MPDYHADTYAQFLTQFRKYLNSRAIVAARQGAKAYSKIWRRVYESVNVGGRTMPAATFDNYERGIFIHEVTNTAELAEVLVANKTKYANKLELGGEVSPTLEDIKNWVSQKRKRYGFQGSPVSVFNNLIQNGLTPEPIGLVASNTEEPNLLQDIFDAFDRG